MKKLIIAFIALGIALALSTNVKGQETQNITVTATVLQVIAFTDLTNISFGNVQTGAVAEINAGTGDGTASSNASAPTAGAVTITGGATNYIIQQTTSPVLSNGSENLAFTPRYSDGTNMITGDITGGGYTKTGGLAITLGIGGQLANPSVAGSYTTATGAGAQNLVLTVSYVL